MQAYDSVAIKADLELGGTDQTFNILMGRNIQKDFGLEPQITLFMPIIEGLDGVNKMSKSLGNYIGVSEDANSMFEKVMKVPDNLIIRYYELCTDVHPDDVEKVKQRLEAGENPRNIKMELAYAITELYHTKEETEKAKEHFITAYTEQKAPEDIPELKINKENDIANEVLEAILSTGKYQSKGEIKRLFNQGAVKFNGEKVTDFKQITSLDEEAILQIGKGNYYKLV